MDALTRAFDEEFVAVEITGGCLVAVYLVWSAYANVMASERLKVGRVDVRGRAGEDG